MNIKLPDTELLLDFLKKEKDKIQEQTCPMRAERDKLLASVQPTLDKIRELEDKYLAIERPRLAELDNQISALCRVLGARRMSDTNNQTV